MLRIETISENKRRFWGPIHFIEKKIILFSIIFFLLYKKLNKRISLDIFAFQIVNPWLKNGMVVVYLCDLSHICILISQKVNLLKAQHFGGTKNVPFVEGHWQGWLKNDIIKRSSDMLFISPLSERNVVILGIDAIKIEPQQIR